MYQLKLNNSLIILPRFVDNAQDTNNSVRMRLIAAGALQAAAAVYCLKPMRKVFTAFRQTLEHACQGTNMNPGP